MKRKRKIKPSFIIKYLAYLKWINLSKQICIHLLGERHTQGHRITVGFALAIVGVGVSKMFPGYLVLHFICDGLGYMIHGIATIPIAEALGRVANSGNTSAPSLYAEDDPELEDNPPLSLDPAQLEKEREAEEIKPDITVLLIYFIATLFL